MNTKYIIIFPLGFILFFSPTIFVKAATLSFRMPAEPIFVGDVFKTEIRLDSEGETINVVSADLNFTQDILEVVSVRHVNSILRLWPKEPAFSNLFGLASIAGGLPTPGFNGKDGLIGVVEFKAKKAGAVELKFGNTSLALLNDGFGSKSQLELGSLQLKIALPPEKYKPKPQEVIIDTISPRAFTPVIGRDDSVFGGRYFVAFETEDFESGIDRYEVQELKGNKWGEWRVVVSPYVLENQEGEITVFVKAVDRAGNETIGTAGATIPKKKLSIYFILSFVLVFLIFVILRVRKYVHRKI